MLSWFIAFFVIIGIINYLGEKGSGGLSGLLEGIVGFVLGIIAIGIFFAIILGLISLL